MKRLTFHIQTHRDIRCPVCQQLLIEPATVFYHYMAICQPCSHNPECLASARKALACIPSQPDLWTTQHNLIFFTPREYTGTLLPSWALDNAGHPANIDD